MPKEITTEQANFVYANEADLLNIALFGKTAIPIAIGTRESNPGKEGNIGDHATCEQLVILSNMESINALLIQQEIPKNERLLQLNKIAITQMKSLLSNKSIKNIHQ